MVSAFVRASNFRLYVLLRMILWGFSVFHVFAHFRDIARYFRFFKCNLFLFSFNSVGFYHFASHNELGVCRAHVRNVCGPILFRLIAQKYICFLYPLVVITCSRISLFSLWVGGWGMLPKSLGYSE